MESTGDTFHAQQSNADNMEVSGTSRVLFRKNFFHFDNFLCEKVNCKILQSKDFNV